MDDGLVLVDRCGGDLGMNIIAYVNVAADMVKGVAVSALRHIMSELGRLRLKLGDGGTIGNLGNVVIDLGLLNFVFFMACSLKNGCVMVVHGRVHVRGLNLGENCISKHIEVMVVEVGASDGVRVDSVVAKVSRGVIIDRFRTRITSGWALRCERIIVHVQVSGVAVGVQILDSVIVVVIMSVVAIVRVRVGDSVGMSVSVIMDTVVIVVSVVMGVVMIFDSASEFEDNAVIIRMVVIVVIMGMVTIVIV